MSMSLGTWIVQIQSVLKILIIDKEKLYGIPNDRWREIRKRIAGSG